MSDKSKDIFLPVCLYFFLFLYENFLKNYISKIINFHAFFPLMYFASYHDKTTCDVEEGEKQNKYGDMKIVRIRRKEKNKNRR